MSENPFESPEQYTSPPVKRAGLGLRILACTLWTLDALIVWQTAVAMRLPEMTERYEQNPTFFVRLGIVALGLPIVGIALLGLACWLRAKWPAIAGVAAFLPLALFLLMLLTRDTFR